MKSQKIIDALGNIDDQLILECLPLAQTRPKRGRVRWLAAAACLALCLLAAPRAWQWLMQGESQTVQPGPAQTENHDPLNMPGTEPQTAFSMRDGTAYSRLMDGTMTDWLDSGCGYSLAGDGTVLLSYDGGETQTETPFRLDEGETASGAGFYLSPSVTSVAYTADGEAAVTVQTSTDQGLTWQESLISQADASQIFIQYTSAEDGWMVLCSFAGMGKETHAIYRTGDQGVTWTAVDGDIDQVYSRMLSGMGFAGDSLGFLCFRYETDFQPAVCVTRDGGLTWSPLEITLPEVYDAYQKTPLSPIAEDGTVILPVLLENAEGQEDQIIQLISRDEGVTWEVQAQVDTADLRQLLQARVSGAVVKERDLRAAFGRYYMEHPTELQLLPVFDADTAPDWDALSRYILLQTKPDGTVTAEAFRSLTAQYVGGVDYVDQSSADLSYADEVYTVNAMGFALGQIYYRLEDLTVLEDGVCQAYFEGFGLGFEDLLVMNGMQDDGALSDNYLALAERYGAGSVTKALLEQVLTDTGGLGDKGLEVMDRVTVTFRLRDSGNPVQYLSCQREPLPDGYECAPAAGSNLTAAPDIKSISLMDEDQSLLANDAGWFQLPDTCVVEVDFSGAVTKAEFYAAPAGTETEAALLGTVVPESGASAVSFQWEVPKDFMGHIFAVLYEGETSTTSELIGVIQMDGLD